MPNSNATKVPPTIAISELTATKPEILQDEATPENLAEALIKLYEDKENAEAVEEAFTDMHWQLRQNTAEKAANAVIECLN